MRWNKKPRLSLLPGHCREEHVAHAYYWNGATPGTGRALTCRQCGGSAGAALELRAHAHPAEGRTVYGVRPHTGAPIDPPGTCDDPFCPCHAAHAATAARDYLRAVDNHSSGITIEVDNEDQG